MAYTSDESGRVEVYVRAASGAGGKWQISNNGGRYPVWARSGRELFYVSLDHHIMALDWAARADLFVPGKPRLWSNRAIFFPRSRSYLDIMPDAKRFVVFQEAETTSGVKDSPRITCLLNFFDELKRRIP